MSHDTAVARKPESWPDEPVSSFSGWPIWSLRPLKRLAAPVALLAIWYALSAGGLLPRQWVAQRGNSNCAVQAVDHVGAAAGCSGRVVAN